jgi:hypothetical protein
MTASKATPGWLWTAVLSIGAEARRFLRLAALREQEREKERCSPEGTALLHFCEPPRNR